MTKIPHRLRKCTDKKKKTPTANSDQQMEIASNDQSCQMDTQYSYSYSTLDQPLNCEESQVKQQYLSNEPVYIYESYERGIYDNNQFVQEDMSYDRFYQFNSGPEQNVQRWEDPLLSQMQNFAAKQLQTITELNSFLGGNIFWFSWGIVSRLAILSYDTNQDCSSKVISKIADFRQCFIFFLLSVSSFISFPRSLTSSLPLIWMFREISNSFFIHFFKLVINQEM